MVRLPRDLQAGKSGAMWDWSAILADADPSLLSAEAELHRPTFDSGRAYRVVVSDRDGRRQAYSERLTHLVREAGILPVISWEGNTLARRIALGSWRDSDRWPASRDLIEQKNTYPWATITMRALARITGGLTSRLSRVRRCHSRTQRPTTETQKAVLR